MTVQIDTDAEATVRANDRGHVFHSWSAQGAIDPLPVAGGEGSTFWDYNGNRYLDFSSQLVNLNLGHQHPDLVAAIQEQAGRLATIQPSMANDVRGELARRIVEVAGDSFQKVFFTNGGADANENAVRMARAFTGRRKVLSMYRSYHGNTTTAISLTGDPRRWQNEPGDGSVAHFFGPYLYRSAFHATTPEEESARAASSSRRPATCRGCGSSATATASCSSPTRSWSASAGWASGSPSRRTTWSPTSSPSRRVSIPATCRSAAS